jgi:hypothetical protein
MMHKLKQPCTAMTRSGKACRNPAVPGTLPPACRRHMSQAAVNPSQAPAHYTTGLSDREKESWTELAGDSSVKDELALVRTVLSRLMDRLNDPTYVLLPEDLRRLTGLIFTGARTVAQLLTQQAGTNKETQAWLGQALTSFSKDHEIEL